MGASSFKELNDFENVMIPVPYYLFKKFHKKNIVNIEDELNKALIEDLILIEGIHQNNIMNINMRI